MIIRNLFFTLLCTLCIVTFAQAQAITTSGFLGYSSPQGSAFEDPATGESQVSFGFGYGAEAMYLFGKTNNQFGAGIIYNGIAIIQENSDNFLGFGGYGLALYGVTGFYRLRPQEKTFSPYGSLGLGLTQLSTPDITINGETISRGSAFSFGIQPKIGLEINGLLIAASYLVPMNYTIESDTGDFEGSAGAFSVTLGYKYYFDGSLMQ